jgi:hypothetical protein
VKQESLAEVVEKIGWVSVYLALRSADGLADNEHLRDLN